MSILFFPANVEFMRILIAPITECMPYSKRTRIGMRHYRMDHFLAVHHAVPRSPNFDACAGFPVSRNCADTVQFVPECVNGKGQSRENGGFQKWL
jgi:hypothetical protein